MDSDSDDDIVTNNVFIFQPDTTISAKGPNITKSLSFHNHMLASINHMPRNIKESGYASSLYDQRSIHSRRDVSPMSVRSAYDFQPRNFNMSHYPRGMSSQRSVLNGRSRSPMSMSMASTTSVSAVDIVMAFKNGQFSKHDWNLISDAYEKFKKLKNRNKSEKRRRLRKFLKGARRRSGGESGEQGSESSISDFDDTRSKRSSILKKNVSSCRSTRTDLSETSLINIRRRRVTSQKSNIYSDCSTKLQQKSFKNIFSIDSSSNRNEPQNIALQRDRFKSGFLLPSQRFNKSVAASTIPENTDKQQTNEYQVSTKEIFCTQDKTSNNSMSTTDSEHEEVFALPPRRVKDFVIQRKRSLEKDEQTYIPHKKRNKLSPIKKLSHDCLSENRNTKQSDKNKDDFVFAKPSLPIKKLKEKLISKSPHVNNIFKKKDLEEQNNALNVQKTIIVQEKEHVQSKEVLEITNNTNTDVSMRPSFIKRKLFTQKMDVAENKILSSDNENSPKTVYSGIQKEKNKARKLVTNQSCLSRDVVGDENYLDLIHKIVPPDQMNSTNQPTKSDNQRKSNEDKLEATSVTSTFNNDSLSDTYTDEEIFHDNTNSKNERKSKTTAASIRHQENCKVVLKKMSFENPQQNETKIPTQHGPSSVISVDKNKSMKTCVKTFWDIDSESDFECQNTNKKINNFNEPLVKGTNFSVGDRQANKLESKQIPSKASDISLLNNTTATDYKFKNTSISIRSHRASKKKKCCEEIDHSSTTFNQTQSQNLKLNDVSCMSYTASINKVKTKNAVKALPENKSVHGRAIRSCRTPKQKANELTKNENKTESNRSLRQRKADLSSSTLDVKATTISKPKKQNMNNSKQSNPNNNKQTENIRSTVNSRKSDISFSLNSDIKAVKTKKSPMKNTELKSRRSNVSFSISSDSPLTRSRAAKLCNESQFKRNNTKFNNEVNNIPPLTEIRTTPNKKNRKNRVFDIVQDLKSKNKSIRKR